MSAQMISAGEIQEAAAMCSPQGETAYGGEAFVTASNRRFEARYPMAIRVKYPRRNAFFFEYTRNISRGGMFIATSKPLDLGERFVFELEVPGEEAPLQLLGEVRWRVTPEDVQGVRKPVEDLEAGMGIAFLFGEEGGDQVAFNARVMEMINEAFGPEIAQELLRTAPGRR